jgi:hypothetical protein
MPVIIVVTVIIQACFIYHVFKTGRPYWWAFVILSFPVIGCVAYYFVEIFPDSREHHAARKAADNIARTIAPDRELKRRVEEMQICGSVENKVALAAECTRSQRHAEAVSLYESCLNGIYAADAQLLLALAEAYFMSGQVEKSSAGLARLKSVNANYKPDRARLLLARLLEARGEDKAALLEYEQLAENAAGLEAKVRYGLLLNRLGFNKQSELVLSEVLRHVRRQNQLPESEREWANIARAHLAGQ